MGLEVGGGGTEEEEEKEKIPLCESIGHRSLRGRCPIKRNSLTGHYIHFFIGKILLKACLLERRLTVPLFKGEEIQGLTSC